MTNSQIEGRIHRLLAQIRPSSMSGLAGIIQYHLIRDRDLVDHWMKIREETDERRLKIRIVGDLLDPIADAVKGWDIGASMGDGIRLRDFVAELMVDSISHKVSTKRVASRWIASKV